MKRTKSMEVLVFAILFAGATYHSHAQGAAPIAQQAYLKASNTGVQDLFGFSVAISGDTIVVASSGEDSNAVGINGVQTNNSAEDSGAAYVFVRDGTNWIQQAYLKASNTGATDVFHSVAISGDTVVVGASGESSNATGVNGNQSSNSAINSGAAYVFVRDGTNWIQQAYLKASNTGADDYFGFSVTVSGDTVVVGAPGEDSNATGVNGRQSNNSAFGSGAAYVFVRSGTNWSQQAYLKASNTGGPSSSADLIFGDEFGWAVAVSGDTVVVTAHYEDSNSTGIDGDQSNNSAQNSGATYVFVRSGTNWSQQAYLKASNPGGPSRGDDAGDGDSFGNSLAISGDTVVIGAPGEDSNATGVNGNQSNNSAINSGAAYVFVRDGTNWSQQAYLKASNALAYPTTGEFGQSVAVSGDTVVVATGGEDSNATGINGNQTNHSAPFSGAAYVFKRTGTNWSQQAYLKASNTGVNDEFGWAAAVSGNTVVVGSRGEDSKATGVNGNQSNNSAVESGAAYVFTGFGVGVHLALAPDDHGGYLINFKGIPDLTYRLQRAPSVSGPWDTIATQTAPASGFIEFRERTPLKDVGFYRTVQP
jgi:hypothetical protein